MKIMGHEKSTVKSRATHRLKKPNENNGPQEEYSEKQGNLQAKKPNEDKQSTVKSRATHRLENQKIMGHKMSRESITRTLDNEKQSNSPTKKIKCRE